MIIISVLAASDSILHCHIFVSFLSSVRKKKIAIKINSLNRETLHFRGQRVYIIAREVLWEIKAFKRTRRRLRRHVYSFFLLPCCCEPQSSKRHSRLDLIRFAVKTVV